MKQVTTTQLKWSRTVLVGLVALATVGGIAIYGPAEARSEAYMAVMSIMSIVAGRNQAAQREP